MFVIQPGDVSSFLVSLAGAAFRVGKVTEERLKQIGVATVGDLRGLAIRN